MTPTTKSSISGEDLAQKWSCFLLGLCERCAIPSTERRHHFDARGRNIKEEGVYGSAASKRLEGKSVYVMMGRALAASFFSQHSKDSPGKVFFEPTPTVD
ncbi:hypothetical protein OUZ56_031638 [Daphnia magna]|uniref:Uncharacterized protein n=1 Tax=Daphnia magna TaxID=35525 RepID=A0ABQ9ZVK9_9CRUS|nr:hypothetical protein OUZ56_031638 [Daphnia magna]